MSFTFLTPLALHSSCTLKRSDCELQSRNKMIKSGGLLITTFIFTRVHFRSCWTESFYFSASVCIISWRNHSTSPPFLLSYQFYRSYFILFALDDRSSQCITKPYIQYYCHFHLLPNLVSGNWQPTSFFR